MMRSLFLFDMTFWLYLAALGLYVGYLFAKRPTMQLAAAGHPIENLEERDGAWATQLGQVATLVTVFGWLLNTLALVTRAFERMQHSGTFAPWSNQFEAMAYVSWAIILGYVLLEFRYRIKAVGAFVVGIGFIAMGAASLLPYRYQTAEPLVPALNSYWIYIHVSVTLTSYAAFAMAGGLGLMYLFKERAINRGSQSRFYAAFPDLETIDELGYKAIMLGFPLLAFGIILGAMWANYAWGGYWSWDPKETWSLIVWLIYGAYIHARMTRGWEGHKAAVYAIFGFLMVIFCFWGVNFLLSGLHAYA
ncbi:c-type cytochrome biogenesis protein CcsB [Nitrospirales bacterium NOB]|nr:MAG: cytochrome c biogenesis protein CcsA [Nitrospira sp. OLB3]MCE7966435.1 c-type cytochrome biogenesis protein CcsB [Nitrospira sp. NTP2]MCK6493179.1 c-type cytochrome biogenesis protein CcsB [Nitrospira sp.]MDL1888893.1 c-type cytochrome biogenesis protein CcsB [Nitrospirales bacterium NOB]MEB2339340.1 c-type cytochrome biogenesis protein CcsB [Nitrospirales bacterium]